MEVSLFEPLPPRLAVGGGTALFLHGRCSRPQGRIRSLRVLGNRDASVSARRAGDEWWAIVLFGPGEEPRSVPLRLRAELEGGGEQVATLGTVELEPRDSAAPEGAPPVPRDREDGALVAICMATHDPPLDLFERQVASIRGQSHGNWVCVISDDASPPERLEQMRDILGDDPRIRLYPSEDRLGFYRNFERALGAVPREADYVALCDQDDRWHPDKLALLCRALEDGGALSYSDMRIVLADGRVASDTYWRHRRNNHTDLESLLIGNTITGAASLFRRDLLERALPFPPQLGRAYHDHWIALVAIALGEVRYVDKALHDYVQHPGAVIGFSSANAGQGADGRRLAHGLRRAGRLTGRLIRPEARRRYFEDYCRIALAATVLELRLGGSISPEKRAAVERVRAYDDSLREAAGLAWRSLARSNETMGVDRSVLAGVAWSLLLRSRDRAASRGS